MQASGNSSSGAVLKGASSTSLDMSNVITQLQSVEEVWGLPKGAVIGDQHGGLTFSDAVAYALERRSVRGWHEVAAPDGERWTVIRLDC
jgi:hypothetical protein